MAAIGILRAPMRRTDMAFGVIHPKQTIVRYTIRSHWRLTLAIALLALGSASLFGEGISYSISRVPVPQKSVTLARTRRQPVSTPKKGRVWMPALAAAAKLDLIERMEDGSLGHFAYFDIPLAPQGTSRPVATTGTLAAYQEPQTVADPFGLVLRQAKAEVRRPAQKQLSDTPNQPMLMRGETINVSVAKVHPAAPVRRLVSLPARTERLADMQGAADVPEAEFERLGKQLGTQSLAPGEELDLLVGAHPAKPGVQQIVFARHVSADAGERLLARRDDGGFQLVQDHHLYDRLMAEAMSHENEAEFAQPGTTGADTSRIAQRTSDDQPADQADVESKLRKAASDYPHLFEHLAEAKVPPDVGLQVVGLLRANSIRWNADDVPPLSDVVFRRGEDGENELVSVSVHSAGKERQFYRYASADDGEAEFYDNDGRSVSKTLMRKPVKAGQLGDGFGWRVHPILQTRKFHNGVDYRAPQGSPIVAAGDGVVEKISWEDGYGKYVRIHHDGGYSTTYAHIEKTPADLKVGQRVSQGQVIAYVGSTGLSTGPHLYYELRVGNTYADPTKAQMPAGTVLRGRALDAFHKQVDRVDAIATAIRTSAQSAAEAVGQALRPASKPD